MLIGHPAPEDSCLRLVGRTKVSCHSGIAFRVPSASRDQLGKLIQLYHQGVGSHGKGPLGNPFGKDSMIISFPHSCKGPQHRYPKPMTIPLPRSLVCFISALVPMFPTTLGGLGTPRLSSTRSFRAQQLPQYLTAVGKIFKELLPVPSRVWCDQYIGFIVGRGKPK